MTQRQCAENIADQVAAELAKMPEDMLESAMKNQVAAIAELCMVNGIEEKEAYSFASLVAARVWSRRSEHLRRGEGSPVSASKRLQ